MILNNNSKNSSLSQDCLIAYSLFDKIIGLLNPNSPRTLIFFTRWGIHTCFLKKPIDVLILNDEWEVSKLIKNLKPYSFCFYNPLLRIVIELPENTIKKSHTALGDKIFLA